MCLGTQSCDRRHWGLKGVCIMFAEVLNLLPIGPYVGLKLEPRIDLSQKAL